MSPITSTVSNYMPTKNTIIDTGDVPKGFICPLTEKIMVDPMASKYGHNYERKAILQWVGAKGYCPTTSQPLFPSMLITNVQLRFRIQHWHTARGEKVDYDLKQQGEKYIADQSETEEETEIEAEVNADIDAGLDPELEAEIDAEIDAIVENMRRIIQDDRLGHREAQRKEAKKIVKSRGFLRRFGLKSKR